MRGSLCKGSAVVDGNVLQTKRDCNLEDISYRYVYATEHVKTCALLVREYAQDDEVVSIEVDLDGIELDQGRYVPPEKPKHKNIKQWILDKYGFRVSTLYIA